MRRIENSLMADVVLLCFSISSPQSFKHCKTKWYPEIRQYCPQTPIVVVGCKNDLRHIYRDDGFVTLCNNRPFLKLVEEHKLITREQGRKLASEIGAVYYEASVYTYYGIENIFENAVRLALIARRLRRFWAKNLKNVLPPVPQMPYLPPPPKEPDVKTLPSRFQAQMRSLLDKGSLSDVKLKAAGEFFPVHKVILAAASSFFKRIFISSSDCPQVNLADLHFVSPQSFRSYLSFLYCGELSIASSIALGDIKEAATLTKIDHLLDLIDDTEEHNGEKRNNIEENYQRHFKANLKQICLTENLYTDVIFIVDDGECHAHRSVLMARCDVMAAMFGGDFRESSIEKVPFPGVSKSTFQICLHYLYTDTIDEAVRIQNGAAVLELANRLCLAPLISLVEKRIINELKLMDSKEIDINEYVFHFLEMCQLHNADQLFEWCQYYIITNYQSIKLNAPMLLRRVHEDYQDYLQKNRWPPHEYLSEREYYDISMKERRMNDKTTGFAFLLSARKRFSNCLSSFRKSNSLEVITETTTKASILTYLTRKNRLI